MKAMLAIPESGTHFCPLFHKRIGKALCRDKTSVIPVNERTCCRVKCGSPWRLCLVCLKFGDKDDASRVVNPATSHCAFHLKNSPELRKPKDFGQKPERLSIIAALVQKRQENKRDGNDSQPHSTKVLLSFSPLSSQEISASASVLKPKEETPADDFQKKVLRLPRNKIRPMVNQPRQHFDIEALRDLAASIQEIGQIVPILVKPIENEKHHDYEIIDGERRWRACKIANVDFMWAVLNEVTDEEHQFETSAVANFGRLGHTDLEIARALKRIMEKRGRTQEQVAKIFGCSIAWVSLHLSLFKLHPEVLSMMEPSIPESRRLVYTIATELAKIPEEHQINLALEIIKKDIKSHQARFFIRRHVEEAGLPQNTKTRKRKPIDNLMVFEANLDSAKKRFETFLDMSETRFKEMFSNQTAERLRKSISESLALTDCLDQIIQALRRIEQEKNPATVAEQGSQS